MKKNKILSLILVSFLGFGFTVNASAYSDSVNKKLERIDEDIKKTQEKISKKNSNSYGSSNSSSSRTQKLEDKISDYEKEKQDIIKKEEDRISKAVKNVETKKKQSESKIKSATAVIEKKKQAAQKKYDNDKKMMLAKNPSAVIQPFKFTSTSEEKIIEAEKAKIKQYEIDIQKIRNPSSKKRK